MMRAMSVLVVLVVMGLGGCAADGEGYCPEPELVEHATTCSFFLQHTEDVPDLMCRVPNGFQDPILAGPPVLVDSVGIWVPAKHRLDDRGQQCGESFGAIVSQQYRPGWTRAQPDCVWVACNAFAELRTRPE
jgi:hypothetical protein